MIILIIFSFIAGVVTVLSPCILPILPIILTSTIGGKYVGRARPIGVVSGFVASFTFFTLFLSSIVRVSGISADVLRLLSIFVIAVFGVSLLIPYVQTLTEKLFTKIANLIPSNQNKSGFVGGFVIGMSVGLLWTPCVGPILASVISLSIIGTVTLDAFLITLAFSIGTGIPMLLIMIGGQSALKNVPWLLKNTVNIQKAFGVLMVLTAIGIFFNFDRKFQSFILDKFPNYGAGLTKLEDNEKVKKELENFSNQRTNVFTPKLINKKFLAPEIIPGGEWFNSKPLSLKDLKGSVVLVDFWTYTCINCQRTLPYIKDWYKKYKDKGFVVVGVHSPEFEFEKNPKNVQAAIKDFELLYPIVQDNNFDTWQAYGNRAWPSKYLIDKDGYIRYFKEGEYGYDETEAAIQELLKEKGTQVTDEINNPGYSINSKTPETYLGTWRIAGFASPENIVKDKIISYSLPKNLGSNKFAFEGSWEVMEKYANPAKGSVLLFNFDAKEVFLVMRNKGVTAKVKVYLDDKLVSLGEDVVDGVVTIDEDRLYELIKLEVPGRHTLKLEFLDNNVELYAFTFG